MAGPATSLNHLGLMDYAPTATSPPLKDNTHGDATGNMVSPRRSEHCDANAPASTQASTFRELSAPDAVSKAATTRNRLENTYTELFSGDKVVQRAPGALGTFDPRDPPKKRISYGGYVSHRG